MNSNELIEYWLRSSENDYETMNILFTNNQNSWSLFLGHLVIEKLLKALYAQNNVDNPIAPKIHNLILLSQKSNLDIPIELKSKIQVINTFNIAARYDDYKENFSKKCTTEYTTKQIDNIKEVRIWLKEQLITKY